MSQIGEKVWTRGRAKPSPGSLYPTVGGLFTEYARRSELHRTGAHKITFDNTPISPFESRIHPPESYTGILL